VRGVVVKKLELKENCETYGGEASLLMVKSLDIKTISPANSIAPQISCFQFICARKSMRIDHRLLHIFQSISIDTHTFSFRYHGHLNKPSSRSSCQ